MAQLAATGLVFDDPVADPAGIALYYAARTAKENFRSFIRRGRLVCGYGIYKEPLLCDQ